jgi:hypothetical protein
MKNLNKSYRFSYSTWEPYTSDSSGGSIFLFEAITALYPVEKASNNDFVTLINARWYVGQQPLI